MSVYVADIDDKDIYVQLPTGYEDPEGYVAKLSRSLYGLRDATYRFHKTLADWMSSYGFIALDPDRTLFQIMMQRGEEILIVALYVDDGLVAHNSDKLYHEFISSLSERFELSADHTEVSWYLGMSIQRDWKRGTIKLSQKQYVLDLLERFKMSDCNPVSTPMEVGLRLTLSTPDPATVKQYQQLLRTLNYLNAWTQCDLAYPISQCARFMSNPGPGDRCASY